tara:strand:- start:805 stop:1584 length:780 start_codon:yes stop_codon:yes gene_type:complete
MEFKTYIINLKKDTEKYKILSKKLDNIGINYERFNAIDGKNLENKYNDYISIYKKFIPQAIIGCGLSHFFICKQHFTNYKNIPALILEDDAEPLFKNYQQINNVLRNAPKDWEIVLLYSHGITNYRDNTWKCNYGVGSTIGYLINYEGFKKRYNNYKLIYHTDFERWFTKTKIYKTPDLLVEPCNYKSSTSSKYSLNYSLINFLNWVFSYYLESEITQAKFDMFCRYKQIRIPFVNIELDFLQIILIIIFLSVIYKIII